IELIRVKNPQRLVLGEGIETVLSVWHALAALERDLSSTAFSSSADLGNLGGRSAVPVEHPTLKTAAGRPQRVPGPEPDFGVPGISIPGGVTEIVLLGDGDSDRFVTEWGLTRAAGRITNPSRAGP